MPVTNIKSEWSSGNLVFYEGSVGRSTAGDVLTIGTTSVVVGGSAQDVDFKVWMGAADQYVLFDVGNAKVTFAKVDVDINGDLTLDLEDLNLGDDQDIEFGDGQDALIRWSTVDASNHALVLGLGDTSQQLHITDKGAIATDWARSAGTHPEVAIHSNTTPATDYLAIGNHDGTTASLDVVGGTTLAFKIAGTAEINITADGILPETSDGSALGSGTKMFSDLFLAEGAVINFNNGNVTLTHSAGLLTLGGGISVGADINVANAALDLIVKANQDSALEFYDGTTKFIDIDTRNTVTGVSNLTFTAMPSTIVAASGVTKNLLTLTPGTTTLTGSTGVTALNGLALNIAQPTVTDEDAVTVATASTVYIANAPTGAGSGPATLTNSYALNVADGGVYVGGGGIALAGTGAAASSKVISTSGYTLNNADLGDGYGAAEVDLTLTGTSAGHVAALSSWININAGTHGGGGKFIAAQTNGIYEDAAATITGAYLVYGLRMQLITGDTDADKVVAFSINTSGETTDALIGCNTPANDLGVVTNNGSADGDLMPLFIVGNGTKKYVKLYDLA